MGKKILITGGAGFIGSHIVKQLVSLGHDCKVLDNLSTGSMGNLSPLIDQNKIKFIEGSITDQNVCEKAVENVEIVFHLAALGSVPRSINNPIATNEVNVSGFLNVLFSAKESGVKRVVFSSSSSVYGDDSHLPKREEVVGKPLSPYAISKIANEWYGLNFSELYDIDVIGLRYFNVFGPNQNPEGPYAAVIPIFVENMIQNRPCYINGDGTITRDFTYVQNVVDANIKAAFTTNTQALNRIYNIAYGETTSLLDLHTLIAEALEKKAEPIFREERPGDIKNSLADITLAKTHLNFNPDVSLREGLKITVDWYQKNLK